MSNPYSDNPYESPIVRAEFADESKPIGDSPFGFWLVMVIYAVVAVTVVPVLIALIAMELAGI